MLAPVAVAAPTTAAGPLLAPGTDGLQLDLAIAYTLASRDARAAGVPMYINSGKRSRAEQAVLWRQGLVTYGSPGAARRWVLPPGESTHVTGAAIDVGPRSGAAWLQRNGGRYGLCRPFENEWWHFERLALPGAACPPRVRDASVRK
ncbi:MAG: M15 family metallopeptidase [Gordonia sp. (in: high G+C Gram-positive bacteria)]